MTRRAEPRPPSAVTTPLSGSKTASTTASSSLRAISRTHPPARCRTMRTSSSASCPPAAARAESFAPGSTETEARTAPPTRDHPIRPGGGTTSARSETASPGSATSSIGVPGGIRPGSTSSDTLRRSPGWRRIGDCLKRMGDPEGAAPGPGGGVPPGPAAGAPGSIAARGEGAPPRSNAAFPGVSNAVRRASFSARSPSASRALIARPALMRCAPARRSSSATIGRSTRSMAS